MLTLWRQTWDQITQTDCEHYGSLNVTPFSLPSSARLKQNKDSKSAGMRESDENDCFIQSQ